MKILVLGDCHCDINHIYLALNIAEENQCDQIIQVGDFGYFPHLRESQIFLHKINSPIPFYWLDGNHDFTEALGHLSEEAIEIKRNLFYLPRGYVWRVEHLRFMALGGAYSIDKYRRIQGLNWCPREEISYMEANRALLAGGADIMFTHDAPASIPITSILGPGAKDIEEALPNRRLLEAVFNEICPKLLIHGHYHSRYEYKAGWRNVMGLHCNLKPQESFYILDTQDW